MRRPRSQPEPTGNNVTKRRVKPATANPYRDGDNLARLVSLSLRLFAFVVVVTLFVGALLIVYQRWQAAGSAFPPPVSADTGNPQLSLIERLYLQTYLATHGADLQTAAGAGQDASLVFTVASGQTAPQIAANLAAEGLLTPDNENTFLNYLRFYGLDLALEAGQFTLSPALTIPELAGALTQATSPEVVLTFLEGWRLEEIARYLEQVRPARIDPTVFLSIARRQIPFDVTRYDFMASAASNPILPSLEGFLYPDSYRVPTEADAAYLVDLMLRTFGERITPSLRQAFGAQGLTVYQAVTLASIVEREAVLAEEQPIIASVYLNRLNQGMKLDADPTVQFALGYDATGDAWWKTPLSLDDLQFDSPYNTYLYVGLPPGPIANPGLGALTAIADPATSNFLFFVAACDGSRPGSHLFSVTYAEHLVNVASCQ